MIAERHPLAAPVPWPRPHGREAYGASDAQRGRNFPKEYRSTLVDVLRRQGQSKSTAVDKLAQSEAITVTTGQQLGLGLGPLYTVVKIADTIALARALEDRLKIPVVPVFWLASEDHDAQEINHLWHGGQRFSHTVQPAQHAVGSLPASLALPALEGLRQAAKGWHEQEICDRWLQIYRTSHTLAEAVRALVFSYFDPQELVVLDPNDSALKQLFQPVFLREARESLVLNAWNQSKDRFPYPLDKAIAPQTFNAFAFGPTGERRYSEDLQESLHLAETAPERLSPNALLRPIYQEWILPNVAYVGGPGEAVYWNQLPAVFEALDLPLPVFKQRSGATWLSAKGARAWERSGLDWETLLAQTPNERRSLQEAAESAVQSPWSEWQSALQDGFRMLDAQSQAMNPQMEVLAAAWRAKMDREQRKWEEHARRWARENSSKAQDRLELALAEVLPSGIPQERRWTALWAEVQAGRNFAPQLVESLNPWTSEHLVFTPD